MRQPADMFDLATLAELSEESICEVLRHRYEADRIYTLVGDILIFLNPFKAVNVYTEKDFLRFSDPDNAAAAAEGGEGGSWTAHIYGVGAAAFRLRHRDSAILISGESGAGKTESTKLLLHMLRMAAAGSGSTSSVADCLLAANPILEAFGNARTAMNHNSSRFAKFVSIGLQDRRLVSSEVRTYMLEKSRLVSSGGAEGSFHIFYYLWLSTNSFFKETRPAELRQPLTLLPNLDDMAPQYSDAESKAEEVLRSFDRLGFAPQQKAAVFQILSGLLLLANVEFVTEERDHTAQTALAAGSEAAYKAACKQLGLKGKDARKRLLKTLTSAKLQVREEDIYSTFQEDKSRVVLNGCIKAVYAKLFDWIILRINGQLAVASKSDVQQRNREIGVLDIFGFESLDFNSFEQLCINLANEQLQLFFTHHVIRLEQQEYQAEGLSWTEISFDDNQEALDVFLDKPLGILSLLNEESCLSTGSDESLFQKLLAHLGQRPRLEISDRRPCHFAVAHYAGQVAYNIVGMVDKNRDRAPQSTLDALATSKLKILSELLLAGAKTKAPAGGAAPLAAQFRGSLDFLLKKLNEAQPLFVRCVKPNTTNVADSFDAEYVRRQIRYCGIAEAVRVRRAGFPTRCVFKELSSLCPTLFRLRAPSGVGDAAKVKEVLRAARLQPGDFAVGKTKIFLKPAASQRLAAEDQRLERRVVVCQKVARGFLQRRRYAKLKAQELARRSAKKAAAAAPGGSVQSVGGSSVQSVGGSSVQSVGGSSGSDGGSRADTIRWFRGTRQRQLLGGGDFRLWFHGIISREDCNRLLLPLPPGSYLVRVSNSKRGFVLSFKAEQVARHYLVEQLKKGRFTVPGEKQVHRSLGDLIEYHKRNGFRNCSVRLTEPVAQAAENEAEYEELLR